MTSFARSLPVILAGFALLFGASVVMATSHGDDDQAENLPLDALGRWLVEPYSRALLGFAPCVVVLLVGLALLSEATAVVFGP